MLHRVHAAGLEDQLNQAPLRRWSAPVPGMDVQDTPLEAAPRRAWFPGRCPGCDGAVAVCQVRLGYDSGRCPRCGTSWTARPPVSFPSALRPRVSFGSRRTAVLDEHGHVGGGLAPLLPPDLYGLGGDDEPRGGNLRGTSAPFGESMDYNRYWAMVFGEHDARSVALEFELVENGLDEWLGVCESVSAQLDGGGEAWLTEAGEHHYRALDALLTAIADLRVR